MEWIDGVKLNDKKGMVGLDLRPRDVALQLANAFGQMVFIHGFIHGGQLQNSLRFMSICANSDKRSLTSQKCTQSSRTLGLS